MTDSPRRAAFAFIYVTVLLDMLALGIVAPVLPKLVVAFLGGDTEQGARLYGIFGTGWALMQFLFSPLLGALSDRFGRRPVVLLSNFGLGLDYVFMALAPSVEWLLVGRIVSGITSASVATAGAYIADVTPGEGRAGAFGLLGSAFGIGFVLGPATGGLLGGLDPRLPFWVAAGLSLANGAYGLLILPESLPRERRSQLRWRTANPIGALALLRSHRELFGLAAVAFLSGIAHEALPSTFVLYASYRYGWGEQAVGLALAVVGVCAAIVQAGLVRRTVATFGERRTLLLGLVCGSAGFWLFSLAETGLAFCFGIPLMALWGVSGPAAQGLMSRRVGGSEQGQLAGAVTSLRGIAGLFGPGMFTLTFATFIATPERHVPGAPYMLAGALLCASTVLAAIVVTRRHHAASDGSPRS